MICYFEITYKDDKIIAHFKVQGRNDTYQIRIEIKDGKAICNPACCDCKWGSFHGQRKEHLKNNIICWHLRTCLSFLKREGWIQDEQINEEIENEREEESKNNPS